MAQSEKASSDQSTTSTSSDPTPCAGGCGFYGMPERENYCSQCFKKNCPQEANLDTGTNNNNNSNNNTSNNTNTSKSDDSNSHNETESKQDVSAPVAADDSTPTKKVQKKKNRCWNCRKKVTLAGQFECKCGYVFCSLHRYPDAHECDFDWKKQHQDKLAKDNKTVAPSKLNKI